MSRPTGARGLKYNQHFSRMPKKKSRPTGARGLKYITNNNVFTLQIIVASHRGAWIEIISMIEKSLYNSRSRPTGARGLKCFLFQ